MGKYWVKVTVTIAGYLFLFVLLFDSLRPWYEPDWFFGSAIREGIGVKEANWQWRNDKNALPRSIGAMAALDSHRFSAGGEGLLYYSENGGFDWYKAVFTLHSGKTLTENFSVQKIISHDGGFYALVHVFFRDLSGRYVRSYVFHSGDGGREYREFTVLSGAFSDLAVYRNSKRKENLLVAAGRSGEITAITADGMLLSLRRAGKGSLLAVTVTDFGTVIAVGEEGLVVRITRDESVDEQHIAAFSDRKKNRRSHASRRRNGALYAVIVIGGYRVIAAGQEGLFLSEDDGINFMEKKLSSSPVFVSLTGIAYNRAVALDRRGSIYRTLNGGANWDLIHLSENSAPGLLVRTPGNNLYRLKPSSSGKSAVYRSSDGGDFFWPLVSGVVAPRSLTSLPGSAAALTANNLSDGSGILFYFQSGAGHPEIIRSSMHSFSAVERLQNGEIIAGAGKNGIVVSSGGAEHFSLFTPQLLPFPGTGIVPASWDQLELERMNTAKNGVVFFLGKNVILRSADGGKNFQFVSYERGMDFRKLVETRAGELLVLGYQASENRSYFFRSIDQGLSFQTEKIFSGQKFNDIALLDNGGLLAAGVGPGKKGSIFFLELTESGIRDVRPLSGASAFFWDVITPFNDYNFFLIAGYDVKKASAAIFRLNYKNGEIDLKKVWSDPEKTGQKIIALERISARKWLAAGENGIYSSIDNGAAWQKIKISRHVSSQGWIFRIVLVLLFFWSMGAWYFMREKLRRQDQDQLQSDQPVRVAHDDLYGVLPLAESLVTLITSRATTPPMSIGISGPWGCGKSSLMGMVKDMAGRCNVKTVWFNVWYHQNEKHMLASLMRSFQRHVVPSFFTLEHLFFRLRLFYERTLKSHAGFASFLLAVVFLGVISGFAVEFAGVWLSGQNWGVNDYPMITAFLQGGSFTGILFTFSGVYIFFRQTRNFKEVGRLFSQLSRSFSDLFGVRNFDEHMGLRDEFLRELGFLIKASRRRVILFLDDIDRCHDAEVMEVMRTVNYLTGLDDLFIVMGIDHDKVVEAVKRHYLSNYPKGAESNEELYRKIQAQSRNYVNKIFNITVRIPDKSSEFVKAYRPEKNNERQKLYRMIYNWGARVHRLRKNIDHIFLAGFMLITGIYEFRQNHSDLKNFSREISRVILIESGGVQERRGIHKTPGASGEKEYVNEGAVAVYKPAGGFREEPLSPEEERLREGNSKWQRIFLSTLVFLMFSVFLTVVALRRFRVILSYAIQHDARQSALIEERLAPWHEKINPRELKMIRNKINFFLSIGERDFAQQGYFFSLGSKILAYITAVLFYLLIIGTIRKDPVMIALDKITELYYHFLGKLYQPEKLQRKGKANQASVPRRILPPPLFQVGDAERVDDLIVFFQAVSKTRDGGEFDISIHDLKLNDPDWIELHKGLLYMDDLPPEFG